MTTVFVIHLLLVVIAPRGHRADMSKCPFDHPELPFMANMAAADRRRVVGNNCGPLWDLRGWLFFMTIFAFWESATNYCVWSLEVELWV